MAFDHQQRLVEFAAGVYIERDVLRVVDAIRDYDPQLRVKYLDPDQGGDLTDPPYKIMELCPDGFERLVFAVWQLDGRVMERLYAADTQKHDIVGGIVANNAALREKEKRRFREEELAEAREMTAAVIRSPRDTYRFPGPDGTQIVVSATEPVKLVTKSGLEVERAAE